MSIEEIEARRAKRREATEKARDEQYEKDLVEVDKLEEQFGPDRVSVLKMNSFVAGLPTLVVVRTPESAVFNRFRQMVRRSAAKPMEVGNAKDLLATSCVVYPEAAAYERIREEWPSVHDNVGNEAVRLGEAEGKD
jgi:hypothetical protein